ncbi:MAG: hypothetical protein ACK421_08025 [Pseudanabaenaceae cyanobacterium]
MLSETTRGYDCGDKFAAYRTIATLAEYLLLAQEEVGVMHYQGVLTEYKELQDVPCLFSSPSQTSMTRVHSIYAWQ